MLTLSVFIMTRRQLYVCTVLLLLLLNDEGSSCDFHHKVGFRITFSFGVTH